MTAGPLNIAGAAVVITPADVLVIALPGDVELETAHALRDYLERHLAGRWLAINIAGVELAALRDVTPDDDADLEELWTSLGAKVADISPRRFGGTT